eukprot:CAMPEP_0206234688 /NCGR_PEP_ID=MMETSP0047_2-20121206/12726_1 /ASSEMBLY_ACC=CAM_ASM_000192 /TAXON_ID=195065 /ORGANISM="Chroomonas mesostigmatica_cf, Strain CCMP1168" /LENGTH=70 /DNA_ID=CAMNT_0053658795 /DNA_START=97 /DNA_END=309 /DNA_ORIENTATION=-
MFEALCFFTPSQWHGISYKGGGLSTTHGATACDLSDDYSHKDLVLPMTTRQLGLKDPQNYMIGNKKEMWA